MKIKKVVVGILNTNCYIVENNGECLVIDPGSDIDKIVSNINKNVVGVLLTHRHFDHVGALNDLVSKYNVKVYDKSNLKEGINYVGSFKFNVVYNLGHTLDSISFIFGDVMFSGDFIFNNAIGRCDLGGDFDLMKCSIKKLLKEKINYHIYPGHGDDTYLDNERVCLETYIK